MTILTDVGLSPVKPYTPAKPPANPHPETCPGLLYGVELEIEHVPNWDTMGVPGLSSVEDGSLRNNGREFITKPMTLSTLAAVLTAFFTKNKLTDVNYSERCSVHVHANVQDLSWAELESLCMSYQVMEAALFKWIGHNRDQNIFCTPWAQTNLTYDTVTMVRTHGGGALRNWQKYTGLNLLPVLTQGTVEFRHMEGTHDVERILQWASIIGSMFTWATAYPGDKAREQLFALTTAENVARFLVDTFGDNAAQFLSGDVIPLVQEGVLDVKYLVLSSKQKKAPQVMHGNPTTLFDDVFRPARARTIVIDDLQEDRTAPQAVFNVDYRAAAESMNQTLTRLAAAGATEPGEF